MSYTFKAAIGILGRVKQKWRVNLGMTRRNTRWDPNQK
jgi:hypothetical protein